MEAFNRAFLSRLAKQATLIIAISVLCNKVLH